MKTLSNEQLELLMAPLDERAIKQHPTKTYLSSIKAIYVTERMNDVFGVGVWRIKTDAVSHDPATGMVVIKLTYEVPEYGIYYECFGGNDNGGTNSKNFDLGDAYKGATTDAITKVGSFLGIGIDVYKGITPLPVLKVASEKWDSAVSKKVAIEDVLKYYKMTKENQIKYNELIK